MHGSNSEEREKIRFIGIDCPETYGRNNPEKWHGLSDRYLKPWGHKATSIVKDLIESKEVWLEFGEKLRGRYGRLLAYVWLQPDTPLLDSLLIVRGLARHYPSGRLQR